MPVSSPIWRRPVKRVKMNAQNVTVVVTAPTSTARPFEPVMASSASSRFAPFCRSSM